jgi:hypothetical protein
MPAVITVNDSALNELLICPRSECAKMKETIIKNKKENEIEKKK